MSKLSLQLNPSEHGIYDILELIYKEFYELFEYGTFHMGADEVGSTECTEHWPKSWYIGVLLQGSFSLLELQRRHRELHGEYGLG